VQPEPTFTLIVTASSPPPPDAVSGLTPPARPDSPAAVWTRPARLAACALAGLALVLLAARTAGLWPTSGRPTDLDAAPVNRIDLNRANRAELMQLPGVGPALADALLADRERNGPFRAVDELRRVPGVGPTTFARLRPLVEVGAAPVVTAALPAAEPQGPGLFKKTPPSQPINPNRATLGELRQLPGVGQVLALRIVEEREKEPFRKAEDLRRVRGIGVKTLEKMRSYLSFGGDPESRP
jgi:competence protein ComEA